MEQSSTSLLVIQPTPFCNINCSYCYLTDRSSNKRLTHDVAEQIFRNVFSFPTVRESITVVWHAGEPFVLPADYYERMFELVQTITPPDLHVQHSFQTNGTLVTDAWCDLIKKWNLNVGVSIDGPKDLHDRYRKLRNGAGSFDRSLDGLKKLQSRQVPLHVITVLTLESMTEPERLFDFYVENDIDYVCFNIEEQEGANAHSKLVTAKSADLMFRGFLDKFLSLTISRQRQIFVREVEHAMGMIASRGHVPVLNDQNLPFRIISVDCDGNLSTFSPELLGLDHALYGNFFFGNVIKDSFEEIATRIAQSSVYRDVDAGVKACAENCSYFSLCGGGAPSNKIFENGSAATTETAHCRAFMQSVDVVLDLIERLPPDLLAANERILAQSSWPG